MQQYKIFIANERYRYMKPLQVFILLINAISLTLVAFYANDPLGYVWPPLILLSILFVLYDQKLKRFAFFKKTNFLDTGFLWVIAAWILAGYLWIALAIVVIGGLITSTLLTLLILPVIYSLVYDLMHRRENRKLLRKLGAISSPSPEIKEDGEIN